MSTSPDPFDPLVPVARSHPVVRYATWGLMGIGALVVLRWALTLLLNPFLLVLLVGGGVFAWTKLSKPSRASAAQKVAPMPAEIDDPVARSQAELDAFDRRLHELEQMRAEQQRTAR